MNAAIYQAQVISARDPLGLGRAKVVIPQVSGNAVSAWAEPSVRTYGPPPAPGSTVWVSLDTGDAGKPVYFTGPTYGLWIAPSALWLGANITAGSAAYRTGPGGRIEWRGALSTTLSPLAAGAALLGAAAIKPAAPVGVGAVLSAASAVVGSLALDTSGNLTWSAGAASFTGTAQIYLSSLTYSAI